jgi:threonine dehydrogenase-like Zn-dependent dehydrogenase
MMPATMNSIVFTGPEQVAVREMPVPLLTDNQVLVQVKACAICTWEQRFFRGSKSEDYPFRGGHEVSGLVVAKGSKALCGAAVGDPVALAIMTRCGQCENCRRGMDNMCENDKGGYLPGQAWGPGGMSEYVVAEDYQVYAAAPSRDLCEMALAEPVACVSRSVRRTPLAFGDTVIVQGAGIMGLLHLQLLRLRGTRVVIAEPDANRRKVALDLGAAAAFDPQTEDLVNYVGDLTGGHGAEAIFFTAGGVPAIKPAIPALAKGGWLVLYGSIHPKGNLELDPNDIHYRELVLTGSFSHDKESFRESVGMLNGGVVSVAPFVSERVPFTNIDYAMRRAMSKDTYRVVLTF